MKEKLQAITANIKAKWPIRKGCFYCGNKLVSSKEKFTRSCNDCATGARDGFQKMWDGKMKEGLNDVLSVANLGTKKESTKEVAPKVIKQSLEKKRGKIVKQLKKKGLTNQEIEENLSKFEKMELNNIANNVK